MTSFFFVHIPSGAVSTTGQGECLYRHLVAFRIAEKLAEAAATAEENEAGSTIVRSCLDQMSERVGGDGGAISIDTRGQIAIEWNSMRMSWAYAIVDLSADNQTSLLKVHSGCNKGEHFIQDLPLQSL
jgi:isoaspartyl peptidase/L-asparaginase-like protein (Ntn-hydrolase superfamily)